MRVSSGKAPEKLAFQQLLLEAEGTFCAEKGKFILFCSETFQSKKTYMVVIPVRVFLCETQGVHASCLLNKIIFIRCPLFERCVGVERQSMVSVHCDVDLRTPAHQ